MSAQPNNILNFPAGESLDALVARWVEAKRDEDAANARRLAIEQQMCELEPPKEEGARTIELASGAKLTLTGKLTYKVDLPKLQELALKLPEASRPLKTETKADESGLKYLRAKEPALWALIAPAVEVKPAKTAVKVGI